MKKFSIFIFLILNGLIFSNEKPLTDELIYKEIKKTFSNDPVEIVKGIYNIGENKIEKAIPFILRWLEDETITWIQYNGEGKWTRIDQEVENAIIRIGNPALKYIANLLVKKEYPYVSVSQKTQTKIVSIVSKITGKSFKTTTDCVNFLKDIK